MLDLEHLYNHSLLVCSDLCCVVFRCVDMLYDEGYVIRQWSRPHGPYWRFTHEYMNVDGRYPADAIYLQDYYRYPEQIRLVDEYIEAQREPDWCALMILFMCITLPASLWYYVDVMSKV